MIVSVKVSGCRIPAGLILRLYEQETASRESEEIGLGNSAINVWVRNADCEPFHCLPGVDRTIGRSRAPDWAGHPPHARFSAHARLAGNCDHCESAMVPCEVAGRPLQIRCLPAITTPEPMRPQRQSCLTWWLALNQLSSSDVSPSHQNGKSLPLPARTSH